MKLFTFVKNQTSVYFLSRHGHVPRPVQPVSVPRPARSSRPRAGRSGELHFDVRSPQQIESVAGETNILDKQSRFISD